MAQSAIDNDAEFDQLDRLRLVCRSGVSIGRGGSGPGGTRRSASPFCRGAADRARLRRRLSGSRVIRWRSRNVLEACAAGAA